LPHSEISGSTGARPSPELFAACHVLHRLSVPRHSPDALLAKLAHAQPQARGRSQAAADVRAQMSDVREGLSPARGSSLLPAASGIRRPTAALGAEAQASAPRLAPRRLRIPMPRPSQTERLGLLHGHDSLHDVIRSDVRGQMPDGSEPGMDRRRSQPRLTIPVLQRHPDDRVEMPDVNRRPTHEHG
jgi:hypothetical protein